MLENVLTMHYHAGMQERNVSSGFKLNYFFSDLNETKLTTALSMRDVELARPLQFKVT